MKDVTITLHCTVEDGSVADLKKAVENHIEEFVDVEGWNEEIENFYDCTLEVNDSE